MPISKYLDRSGTIAAANTSQQVCSENVGRLSLTIYNPHTEINTLWINFGNPAAVGGAGSIGISPGVAAQFDRTSFVPSDAVFVAGASTGQKYTIKEA